MAALTAPPISASRRSPRGRRSRLSNAGGFTAAAAADSAAAASTRHSSNDPLVLRYFPPILNDAADTAEADFVALSTRRGRRRRRRDEGPSFRRLEIEWNPANRQPRNEAERQSPMNLCCILSLAAHSRPRRINGKRVTVAVFERENYDPWARRPRTLQGFYGHQFKHVLFTWSHARLHDSEPEVGVGDEEPERGDIKRLNSMRESLLKEETDRSFERTTDKNRERRTDKETDKGGERGDWRILDKVSADGKVARGESGGRGNRRTVGENGETTDVVGSKCDVGKLGNQTNVFKQASL